jgi:hypothetical protein
MIARLRKELRPLIFPWIATAVAASMYTPFIPFREGSLPWLAFTLGCLALASTPFGSEFENRTLGLFLSHPRHRAQLWQDKFLAAAIAVISLAMVHGYMYWLRSRGWQDATPGLSFGAVFVITTLCSAGFLTLISRSTVGGVVLTLTLQVSLFWGVSLLQPEPDVPWILSAVALGYSVLMLWAGWRNFASLELRETPAESASLSQTWLPPLTSLLRCRPHGVGLNLIRKELLLQRLLAHASLIFTAIWLVLIGLLFLAPQKADTFEIAFNSMHTVFSGAVLLLAGSLAGSEDRTLGTSVWQLTLPVPARRQWLIKLLTAAGTAFCLGYLLPRILVAITPLESVGTPAAGPDFFLFLVATGVIFFTMGFWFASLGTNVVRAVVSTFVLLFGTASSLGWLVSDMVAYQWYALVRILSYFQLPPDFVRSSSGSLYFLIGTLPVLFLALHQSRQQFSSVHVRPGVRLRYGAMLILFVVSMMYWVSDFRVSQRVAEQWFGNEVLSAVQATPRSAAALRSGLDELLIVPPEELDQTGRLSVQAKTWLRNSTIRVGFYGAQHFGDRGEIVGHRAIGTIWVTFPGARTYTFDPRGMLYR